MSIALVANVSAGSPDAQSITTGNIDTSSADLLIAFVSSYSGGGTAIPALTDSKGNTWTALTARVDGSVIMRLQTFWCIPTSKGSGHNFSASGSGNMYVSLSVAAFSGSAASPYDSENGSISSGTPGTITPSQDNCLVITGIGQQGATTYSINGGFTIPSGASQAWVSSQHQGVSLAYLIQTSAAAANPAWTATNQNAIVSEIAVFKAAAVTGNLFRQSQLAGLGAGGPFFQNPLN